MKKQLSVKKTKEMLKVRNVVRHKLYTEKQHKNSVVVQPDKQPKNRLG